jgi:hypothetical protein
MPLHDLHGKNEVPFRAHCSSELATCTLRLVLAPQNESYLPYNVGRSRPHKLSFCKVQENGILGSLGFGQGAGKIEAFHMKPEDVTKIVPITWG